MSLEPPLNPALAGFKAIAAMTTSGATGLVGIGGTGG